MPGELSESELAHLRAMPELIAQAGADVRTVRGTEVAKRLGKSPKSLSSVRDVLLSKGPIASPEYGLLISMIPLLRRRMAGDIPGHAAGRLVGTLTAPGSRAVSQTPRCQY